MPPSVSPGVTFGSSPGRGSIDRPGLSVRSLIGPMLGSGISAPMLSVPLELGAWHRYALPAIFWAIALFGLDGRLAREIRALLSPDQLLGQESRWRQLGRWIDQRADGTGDRRSRARRFALRAAAMAGAARAIVPLSAWDAALMATEREAQRNNGPPKEAAV